MSRIRKKELADLVDEVEAPYMLEQLRPAYVAINDGVLSVSYNPFQVVRALQRSDLFFSFAKLGSKGEPSRKGIERWVSRFGLPKWGLRWDPSPYRPDEEVVENPVHARMPVEQLREEVRYASDLLGAYLEVRRADTTTIRRRVDGAISASRLNMEFAYAFKENRRRWGLHTGPDDDQETRDAFTLAAAQAALGQVVTGLVSEVRLRAGVQRGEGLVPSFECPDLPSAIYLQFYLLVTKHKPVKHCEYCGEPFEDTRPDRRFCDASCRSGNRHNRGR